jgi:colanic acid/amylovoran biosynthesis glycosyltransferase
MNAQDSQAAGAGSRVENAYGRGAERRPGGPAGRPVVAYIFTTFPKSTETFIQREVSGLLARGWELRLYSIWGGGGEFEGRPVERFAKWKLVGLLWVLPWLVLCRPGAAWALLRGAMRRPPSLLNLGENLISIGFALVYAAHFRWLRPAHVHAVWGGGPSAAAWLLWRLDGHAFSGAGHAYDLYQNGGDGWLREKLGPALFVHTSTEMGARTLREKGVAADKIHVIRRGLVKLPPLKPLRKERVRLRLLCVARLVAKKGFDYQVRIYAALLEAGVDFEARIAGEGPLRGEIEAALLGAGLTKRVTLLGHRAQSEVEVLREWADVLLHTGVVAADGDRDGLPNVIPEAMAAGVVVVTSPAAATTEAIQDGDTGRVARPEDATAWVRILRELGEDDMQAERLRREARAWVEREFDAHKNAGRLGELYQRYA